MLVLPNRKKKHQKRYYRIAANNVLARKQAAEIESSNYNENDRYSNQVLKWDSVPIGYWCDKANQVQFMNWLAKQLGITHWEQWYDVNTSQILRKGGRGLLDYHYQRSPAALLQGVYPQHPWAMWKF